MSCGASNDADDCREILDQVHEYLHSELDEDTVGKIKAHLDDCSPCLAEYGIEETLRKLISTACRDQEAPESLRLQISAKIRSQRFEVG